MGEKGRIAINFSVTATEMREGYIIQMKFLLLYIKVQYKYSHLCWKQALVNILEGKIKCLCWEIPYHVGAVAPPECNHTFGCHHAPVRISSAIARHVTETFMGERDGS